MAINERIERIKQYFISFNVMAAEDASYALVRFPKGWTIPDQTALKETYGVEISARQEGIYFVTEISNNVEQIFDCIEYVVEFNRNVEERKTILSQKIKELSDIFATEPLEKLKTLEFRFGKATKTTKTKKTVENAEIKEEPKKEEAKAEPIQEEKTVQNKEDNGLMSLAKSLITED